MRGAAAGAAAARAGCGAAAAAGAARQRDREAAARAGAALSPSTVPPCSSTRLRTIARPRPRPPLRALQRLRRPARSARRRAAAARRAMPTPSSSTRTTRASPRSSPQLDRDAPPGSENLAALVSRLQTTCASRTGSPSTQTGCAGTRHDRRARRPRQRRLASSSARSTTSAQVDRSLAAARPCRRVMRETSSRSSTRRDRCVTWRSMTCRSGASLAPFLRAISSSEVTIGASGLRSSWPSMARNSSLTRPADCACASAARDSANRRTLSSASAARRAISPTRATSSGSKRRPDSAWITAIAPIVRPRATSGITQAARKATTRTNAATPGSAMAAIAASSKWATKVWPVAIAHGNVPGAAAEATLCATQAEIAFVRSASKWWVSFSRARRRR